VVQLHRTVEQEVGPSPRIELAVERGTRLDVDEVTGVTELVQLTPAAPAAEGRVSDAVEVSIAMSCHGLIVQGAAPAHHQG
jgi:hypothetical protein